MRSRTFRHGVSAHWEGWSRPRRIPLLATLLALLVTAVTATASSAITNDVVTGSVTTRFCWQWFGSLVYGSGFEIKMQVINNTPSGHTGAALVSGVTQATIPTAARSTSAWKSVIVSKDLGQNFTYRMDGASTPYTNLDWKGIRYYMSNCQTQAVTNASIRAAMTYAVNKVGDRYTGGGAGESYRHGAIAPYRVGPFHGAGQTYYYYLEGGFAGWDCSGLTNRAFGSVGVSIPDYTGTASNGGLYQRAVSANISLANRRPGDLLVVVGHVGMYLGTGIDGNQWVVEATPWHKWPDNGSLYVDAEGVTITLYSTFISGKSYRVYRPIA